MINEDVKDIFHRKVIVSKLRRNYVSNNKENLE